MELISIEKKTPTLSLDDQIPHNVMDRYNQLNHSDFQK